jgi:hypothetical protein
MYDQTDKGHYDYFDYIDDNGDEQQYEPDSDMDFIQFKELMKKEWANRPTQSAMDIIGSYYNRIKAIIIGWVF